MKELEDNYPCKFEKKRGKYILTIENMDYYRCPDILCRAANKITTIEVHKDRDNPMKYILKLEF
jgi:hypothetical protein